MQSTVVLVGPHAPAPNLKVVPADTAIVIGRSSQCDVIVNHLSVSRRHALVTRSGNSGVRVVDLESRNGTFVDDDRIGEAVVSCGRRIRFGDVSFLVYQENGAFGSNDSSLDTDGTPYGKSRPPAWSVGARLTEAQREILSLLAQGLPEKLIAKRHGVSVHTVHNHISAIYKTLGVHSRAELMVLILQEMQERGGRVISR